MRFDNFNNFRMSRVARATVASRPILGTCGGSCKGRSSWCRPNLNQGLGGPFGEVPLIRCPRMWWPRNWGYRLPRCVRRDLAYCVASVGS